MFRTLRVVRLGQAIPPPAKPPTPSGDIPSTLKAVEERVAAEVKAISVKSALIGGGLGLLAGFIVVPLVQNLMGYERVKKSDLERQELPAIGRRRKKAY